jgi:hypothetical protein
MAKQRLHARLLRFPEGQDPSGGRVVAVRVEEKGKWNDVVLDYDELQVKGTPRMFEQEGRPWEEVDGIYHPRRLRFVGAEVVEGGAFVGYFDSLPPEERARIIKDAAGWRTMEGKTFYYFGLRQGLLVVTAQRCEAEERDGRGETVLLSRNQCPSPTFGARLVPNRRRLYERYGGDAVAVRLNGRLQWRRLFIGGMDMQGAARPEVGAVLNLSEYASRWVVTEVRHEADRWAAKSEGSKGMGASEIAEEARWVIERLEAGQRVLVHCTAGMNRSATVCCAVVMLLEGISAESALARVRETHPWARPDGYHWLALRWMEKN